MSKAYFHNNKTAHESKEQKISTQTMMNPESIVNINILLNRVKLKKKNEVKKKFIFFSFTTLLLSLFASFIVIVK